MPKHIPKKVLLICVLLSIFSATLISHAQDATPTPAPDTDQPTETRLRVANLLSEATTLDLWVDGQPFALEIPQGGFSPFIPILNGDYEFTLVRSGLTLDEGAMFIATLGTANEGWSTLVATGSADPDTPPYDINIQAQVTGEFTQDHTRLYIYNALQDTRFEIRENDASIITLPYASLWPSNRVQGVYPIQIVDADDPTNIIADLNEITFGPYMSYFIGIHEVDGQRVVSIGETDLGVQVNVSHYGLGVGVVDIYFSDFQVAGGVTYANPPAPLRLPNDTYEVTAYPSGLTDDALLPTRDLVLQPGQTYDLMLTSETADGLSLYSEAYSPELLVENDALLSGTNAFVHIFHAVPEAPPVDVILADGTLWAEDLAYGDSMAALDVLAGEYDILVTAANDPETVFYELSEVNLRGGVYYKLVAIGNIAEIESGAARLLITSNCYGLDGCPTD